MTWRLVVGVLLSSVPPVTLTPWTPVKGGQAQELRFTDKTGEHVVRWLLTDTNGKGENADRVVTRELTVTHVVGKKELFKARDFERDCDFDLTLELLEGSVQVTDLDDDGEPEISFAYQLACRSDVSPLTVKLLMYEGSTKYALRGQSRTQVGETEFIGGDFKADPAFDKAPKAFLAFASKRWKELVAEVRQP